MQYCDNYSQQKPIEIFVKKYTSAATTIKYRRESFLKMPYHVK